jgi:glycosyltransferase involved in cell wall biosynthesis
LYELSHELGKNVLTFLIALPSKPQKIVNNDFIKKIGSLGGVQRGRLSGHSWEQLELPFVDKDAWLFNPCNLGPVIRRRQILMIHDAQTFSFPQSYSRTFRNWYRRILPRIARRAEIVITVSEYSKKQLEHFGVVPPGKTHVIPNGVDHIARIRADQNTLSCHNLKKRGYFLFIGNLALHKNLAMLIKAATARPPGEPQLVIAGSGNSKIYSEAKISLGHGVRLLGRVPDSQLKALYENALALTFPSLTEGFGLPPLEAMLCGCPVIATNAGATPEVCGDAAIYVDPHKPEQWAAVMIQLANDDTMQNIYREKGFLQAKHYTWRRSALQLLTIIAQTSVNLSLMNALNTLSD